MRNKQISNPAGVWGAAADTDFQLAFTAVNAAAGTLLPGDVVILSGTAGTSITTTTTDDNKLVAGVVLPEEGGTRTVASTETVAVGGNCDVCCLGVARVNIGAGSVAAGDILTTSTTAKVAVADNTATAGEVLGIALQADAAKDANNTILAFIKLG
jgi:hypothetical protein